MKKLLAAVSGWFRPAVRADAPQWIGPEPSFLPSLHKYVCWPEDTAKLQKLIAEGILPNPSEVVVEFSAPAPIKAPSYIPVGLMMRSRR